MNFQRLFYRYVVRLGNPELAVTLMFAAILAFVGFLYITGILTIMMNIAAAIFGFIWYGVLPWPDCVQARNVDHMDTCGALGVIYLPLTIVLTIVIMMAGSVLIFLFLRAVYRNGRRW